MNVVIYARYSSHKQDENTIEAQLRYCHEYCDKNNYTVINEYIDRSTSASGHIEKRTSFLQMIKDSEKHTFESVVVFKLDRFARNRYDSATYKNKLKKNGVSVFSATENITDTKESIILESVLEGMAEYFSKDLAEKVTSGMREVALKCLYNGGLVPYGYKIVNQKYEIDPNESPYVVEAFTRYANGDSIVSIMDDFNSRHIPTRKHGLWNKNSFHNMFINEKYIGTYKFQDIVIENGIPPIVDIELFNKVRTRSLNKKHSMGGQNYSKVDYLLSCKLFYEDKKMLGNCGTGKSGKKYYYYACDEFRINKDEIENQVCSSILEIMTDEMINEIADLTIQAVDNYNKTHDTTLIIEKELTEVNKKIDNLISTLEKYYSDSVIEKLKEYEKTKKSLTKELEVSSKNKINLTKDMIMFYFNKLLTGDINDTRVQRQLVNIMLDKVIIHKDKTLTIDYNLQKIGFP